MLASRENPQFDNGDQHIGQLNLAKDTHMDVLKTAIDWTKAEMFSSAFFVLFGVLFLLASLGFWQLGKTELAKAHIIPFGVAGVLLLIVGIGLLYSSWAKLTDFPMAYESDASAFVASELARADNTMNEYRIAVLRVIPFIVAACAVLILVFNAPVWRASLITTIAMMSVVLLIDTNANARLEAYKQQLLLFEKRG